MNPSEISTSEPSEFSVAESESERPNNIEELVAGLQRAISEMPVNPEAAAEALAESRSEKIAALREAAALPRRALRTLEDPRREPPAIYSEKQVALGGLLGRGGITFCIIGGAGRGKTVMATALALDAIHSRLATVRYFPLLELMFLFEAVRKDSESRSRYELLSELANVNLLILDECDKGFSTESERRTVFALLDARHRNLRDTLLITHPPECEFESWAGPELVDRIVESGGKLECGWESMR